MIFKQIDEIRRGMKTQTRRLALPYSTGTGEFPCEYFQYPGGEKAVVRYSPGWKFPRTKWQVGKTYAVVPKRGQTGLTDLRIKITNIRREPLQEIGWNDALAEGIHRVSWLPDLPDVAAYYHTHALGETERNFHSPQLAYRDLWQSINKQPGVRWEDNPDVWVIEFEAVHVAAPVQMCLAEPAAP